MDMLQSLMRKMYDTFFNINGAMNVDNLPVDARDIGMVARYERPDMPFDGWGLFIMEASNKQQKQPDAFKITEEGFTRYEARFYDEIQQYFRERTGLVVTVETIHAMELAASKFADYYSRLAVACMQYEAKHAPNSVPVYPVTRTTH